MGVIFIFPPHNLGCVEDALRCWCRPVYQRLGNGWRISHHAYWAEGIDL